MQYSQGDSSGARKGSGERQQHAGDRRWETARQARAVGRLCANISNTATRAHSHSGAKYAGKGRTRNSESKGWLCAIAGRLVYVNQPREHNVSYLYLISHLILYVFAEERQLASLFPERRDSRIGGFEAGVGKIEVVFALAEYVAVCERLFGPVNCRGKPAFPSVAANHPTGSVCHTVLSSPKGQSGAKSVRSTLRESG